VELLGLKPRAYQQSQHLLLVPGFESTKVYAVAGVPASQLLAAVDLDSSQELHPTGCQ